MKQNNKYISYSSMSDMAIEQLPDLKRTCTKGAFQTLRTDLALPDGNRAISVHSSLLLQDPNACDYTSNLITRALAELAGEFGHFLFVGLGNANLTCDALGALTAARITPTRLLGGERKVAVLTPSVSGKTGIDTFETVCAVTERIHPDCVLVCDALAARDPNHIGTTFQLSSCGITPASGVGQASFALTRHTLGCPVISIGVPTVVRAVVLAADMLEGFGSPKESDRILTKILDSPSASMHVCPKEIDTLVACASRVIANAVNAFIARPKSPVLSGMKQPLL